MGTIDDIFLDIELEFFKGMRCKTWWDASTVDRVIGRLKDIKEKVECSKRGNDPNVADADTVSAIFDRKLHPWPRNP
jgi:hypothetical protein